MLTYHSLTHRTLYSSDCSSSVTSTAMNNMRKFLLVAVAASAAAEVANNGGHFGEPVFAAAMAPRDEICPELPKFCTGPAMLHGEATTLTYLCPEMTKVPLTVHVTVTKTTTVTEAGETASVTLVPTAPAVPAVPVIPGVTPIEPTTTITIHTTATQYKTVTVSKISSTPKVDTPTSTPVEDEPLFTTQTSIPSSIPYTTPAFQYPTMPLPIINGTAVGVSYSYSIHNSSLIAPTPYYPNSTVNSVYGTSTANFARQLEPAESSVALSTNTAGQNDVSFLALFLGVMVAALIV